MILQDLDPHFLYFLEKNDLQTITLLSKYHNKLIQTYITPLCYHLLNNQGYKIFTYENSASFIKDGECMSIIDPNNSIKLLLAKLK